MKKIFWTIVMILLVPQMVLAYSFEVDGAKVEFDGSQIKMTDDEGEVVIDESGIVATSEEGQVKIDENSIYAESDDGTFQANDVVVNEDGSVVMNDVNIKLNNDEIDSINIGELGVVVEEEGVISDLVFKEAKDNELIFEQEGNEVRVNIGLKGIKVSDNLGSVIVYYGESGIETSGIKIGDKSGAIYLESDFGQVKMGTLPLQMVRETVNRGVKIERVEFRWELAGESLDYAINGLKKQRVLWIIPVFIDETYLYNVENGQLVRVDKNMWHSILDIIAF